MIAMPGSGRSIRIGEDSVMTASSSQRSKARFALLEKMSHSLGKVSSHQTCSHGLVRIRQRLIVSLKHALEQLSLDRRHRSRRNGLRNSRREGAHLLHKAGMGAVDRRDHRLSGAQEIVEALDVGKMGVDRWLRR